MMPPNTVDIQTYIRGILSNFKFYKEAVVLDYIDNPFFVGQEQLDSYGTGFTLEMIQRCPRGTIVGYPIGESSSPRLFYPFFSNHVFLPVKPGEYVWYFEYGRIHYWMSRRVVDFGYEDVNYAKASNANRAKKITSADRRPKEAYSDTSSDLSSEQAQSLGNEGDLTLSMLPAGLTFDSIKKNSNAGKEVLYEPVPVYSGKVSEFVLQGSNNTTIVQGNNFGGGTQPESGYIDISAGRGRISATGVTVLDDQNPPVASREVLNPDEGEPSIATDASRIVVSHGMDPDGLFQTGLPSGTARQSFSPSIVSKSDKIRVIARSDVAVSVEGSNGCSVVLNSNGNVYVTPAASGKVYLSGPGSDQPYLRYDEFNDIVNRLIDMIAALQSFIPEIAAGAATGAAGLANPALVAGAQATATANSVQGFADTAVQVSDIPLAIDTYISQVEEKLEAIKSQKIVGS